MGQIAFGTHRLSPVNPIPPIPPTRRPPPGYEDFDPDRRYQDEDMPSRKERDKKQEHRQQIS